MKNELIRLEQVSKILQSTSVPSVPRDGWLCAIRTALGMTVHAAAKRANVTPATWLAAEKRETNGTITLQTLKKFLGALGYSLSYVPSTEISLVDTLRRQAFEFAQNEALAVRSTMALENQAPGKEFTNRTIKERAEDIIRSGNWKEIWR